MKFVRSFLPPSLLRPKGTPKVCLVSRNGCLSLHNRTVGKSVRPSAQASMLGLLAYLVPRHTERHFKLIWVSHQVRLPWTVNSFTDFCRQGVRELASDGRKSEFADKGRLFVQMTSPLQPALQNIQNTKILQNGLSEVHIVLLDYWPSIKKGSLH